MIVASTTYESVLLVLKIAFLVLLYLFIWRIVRTAAKDLRLPQESFILRPALAGGPIGQSIRPGRLVVLVSPVLELGEEYELDSSPLTVAPGRTTSPWGTTSSRPRGTSASSRAATASGCRTSARPTARSSTAFASTGRASSCRETSSASARRS